MPSTMIVALTIGDADSIRNAGACLHSHSLNAMLVTLVFGDEFRCTHLEMIKGIKGHGYTSTLVVPIIENTPHEADLCHSMAEGAMDANLSRSPTCPMSSSIDTRSRAMRQQCASIPIQQQYWCAVMACTSGVTLGNRPRHNASATTTSSLLLSRCASLASTRHSHHQAAATQRNSAKVEACNIEAHPSSQPASQPASQPSNSLTSQTTECEIVCHCS